MRWVELPVSAPKPGPGVVVLRGSVWLEGLRSHVRKNGADASSRYAAGIALRELGKRLRLVDSLYNESAVRNCGRDGG